MTKITIKTRRGSRHDNASIILLSHDVPDGLGAVNAAHQVDIEYQFEIFETTFPKTLVSQDTGVVDEDINAAPTLRSRSDHVLHLLDVSDVRTMGHCLATSRLDFSHHSLRGCATTTAAIDRATKIIHNNLCAARC